MEKQLHFKVRLLMQVFPCTALHGTASHAFPGMVFDQADKRDGENKDITRKSSIEVA